ncbi:MAG: hypothetical protein IJR44_05600 [Neisseriaceae bacterium]|nr:hypothetical protein [Neisseriaceae bacterium]
MLKKLCFVGILSACLTVHAGVYECMQNGKVVYTNKKSGACRNATLGNLGSYSSDHSAYAHVSIPHSSSSSSGSKSSGGSSSRATRHGTAAEHVTATAQAQRDTGRLSILQRELANEQKALDNATRNLAAAKAAKKTPDQLTALENAVKDRQENVAALQKEISRM